MKIVGIAMIVFGMMAGASTATLSVKAEKAGKPADQRFFESLGGACCSLVLVVPGFFLALSGGKKGGGKYQRPPQPYSDPVLEQEPYPAQPGAAEPLPRVVGADGKVTLTCMACYADVRVEVPFGLKVVDCPKCGHEIQVTSA